ncbi:DUF5689 domain-containing protein [Aureivirga sp. CE67]|uniref:DUF5689 domain-containing protein n=1 Tax=Aureivirga sp. CE67 TaxID=1788983 RepID=UPI0018CA4FAD|nr:DUF5689 domain-containing protein [Aureivirga sp. CE67]
MKKNYAFLTASILSVASYAQSALITGFVDSPCPGGSGKVLELYVDGTIDFTNWKIQKQTNDNTGDFGSDIDLSGLNSKTDEYVYLTNDAAILEQEFAISTNVIENGGINMNGDDRFQIVDGDGNVIDRFGVDGVDGTGENWEYLDTYLKRNSGTTANGGTFDVNNWTIGELNILDGTGSCQTDPPSGETLSELFQFQTYIDDVVTTDPSLAISSPANNAELAAGTTDVNVEFTLGNFNLSTSDTANDGDGYIVYSMDDFSTTTNKFDDTAIALTGLTAGDHTVKIKLVDNDGNDLAEAVATEVSFSIAAVITTPTLAITSPANDEILAAGTTDVNVAFDLGNFNLSTSDTANDGDGYIVYSMDDFSTTTNKFDDTAIALTGLEAGAHTVKIKLVDNDGNDLAEAVATEVSFSIAVEQTATEMATITALRADFVANGAGTTYELTGEFVLTQKVGYKGRKWIQDKEGTISGIMIEDEDGIITTEMNVGDYVTGFKGEIIEQNNSLKFIPSEDSASVVSSDNTIAPQVVTIEEFNTNGEDYESELVQINTVSFEDADDAATFANGQNYNITDGTNTAVMRTNFYDVDYIGTVIPSGEGNVVGVNVQYNDVYQVSPRTVVDIFDMEVNTDPTLAITSPENNSVFGSDVTELNIAFDLGNFNLSTSESANDGDGYIVYSMDDFTNSTNKFDDTNIALTGLTLGSHTVKIKLVDNDGNDLAEAVMAEVTFTISEAVVVSSITDLRAHVLANGLNNTYEITGDIVLTHKDGFKNRKWIQDANGSTISGIMIFDEEGIITTEMNVGDYISGVKGKVIEFNGLLEIIPTQDASVASSDNDLVAQEITIEELNNNGEDYESELVKIFNVTFTEGDGTAVFVNGQNYSIENGENTGVLRTAFYDVDYIGNVIPTDEKTVVGVASQFNETYQIFPRNAADINDDLDVVEYGNENTISIYPNPTTQSIVRLSKETSFEVVDLLGRSVLKGEKANTIDVSTLTKGTYIVRLENAGNVKLIVR